MTTLVLCIGNRGNGDDGIGPWIADHAPPIPDTVFLDAGVTPENSTAAIKRHNPTRLILIDAAAMDLPPGTLRRIPPGNIQSFSVSTHGLPLSLLIDYLIPTIPDITMIGIQPKTLHGPLSQEAKAAADTLLRLLRNNTIDDIPQL